MKKMNQMFLFAMAMAFMGVSACSSVSYERNLAAEKEASYHKQVGADRF